MYNQAIKLQKKQHIKDWTDCWFGPTKRTGYVAVTNLHYQKFFGANEVDLLLSDTRGKESQYISLNAFGYGSRESVNLRQIRNIGIDLDQYKLGLSKEEAIYQVKMLVDREVLPEPNLILASNGVQLFYSIKDGASPDIGFVVSYITDQFISKLKHLGADSKAKDLSRVMRVPNSINEKNGSVVTPYIWNEMPYTLEELQTYCKPFEQFGNRSLKKQKVARFTSKNASLLYKTNNARLIDLDRLIEIRRGNMTGMRNTFLYVYAYHQALIVNSFADLEYFLEGVCSRIYSTKDKKLSKAEFRRTIRSAYEDAQSFFEHYKANGFKIIYRPNDGIIKPYRTDNLIELLEITVNEQRQLRRIVTKEIGREHDAKRKQVERRAAGVKPREEYEAERKKQTKNKLDVLQRLTDRGLTKSEIALEMGISVDYVKKLKRKLK